MSKSNKRGIKLTKRTHSTATAEEIANWTMPEATPEARKDKLRVYVPVASEEERQRINQLSAEDKRAALLTAVYFEEDEE